MNKSLIVNVIFAICVLSILPPASLSQSAENCCEYPALGYYKILGKSPSKLRDVYELSIGYIGVDKVEECGEPGRLSLRGNLSIIDDKTKTTGTAPDFEVYGTASIREDTVKVPFQIAELFIGVKCEKTISITTDKIGEKYYVITAIFLSDYRKKKGYLYNLVGTIRVYRKGKRTLTYKTKFVTSRE